MIALCPDSSRGHYWRYKAASLRNATLAEQLELISAASDRLNDDQLDKRALFIYFVMSLYIYDSRVLTGEFRSCFKRIRGVEKDTLYPLGLDVPRTFEPVIVVRAAIKALKPGEDDKPLMLKLAHDGFQPPLPFAPVCAFCRQHFLRLSTCTRCRSIKYAQSHSNRAHMNPYVMINCSLLYGCIVCHKLFHHHHQVLFERVSEEGLAAAQASVHKRQAVGSFQPNCFNRS
jgi:hypothetical protein